MKTIKKNIPVIAGASALLLSSFAFSGTLGTTSSDDVIINLDIPALVQISDMADIDLGVFAGVDITSTPELGCVYSNGGTYSLTITSTNTFNLISPTTSDSIAYTVNMGTENAGGTPAPATPVTHGSAITSLTADTASTTCATNGDNLAIDVTVTAAAAGAPSVSPATDYTDTLTLLVAAE